MTDTENLARDLAGRLDRPSLTLLVGDREGELYHLPPELHDLASLHALWGYIGGYASYVGTRFITGLRRSLKLPSADKAGEAVGTAISAKVAHVADELAKKRALPEKDMMQEVGELNGIVAAIRAEPIDKAARGRTRKELQDALKEKGATGRQAAKIAGEIDRTIFGDSEN